MAHHPTEESNASNNPCMGNVIEARLSRRDLLRGSATAVTVSALAGLGLSACGGSGGGGNDAVAETLPLPAGPTLNPTALGFDAIDKSLVDRVTVPVGYQAEVLYALGDPIFTGVSEYKNDGTDVDFDKRAGDHHDGMEYFGLGDDAKHDPERSDRGIICINHENLTDVFLHQNGSTKAADNGGNRPKVEVDREMNGHGVACFEVRRTDGQWSLYRDAVFNRRVTAFTEMQMTGPVAGDALLQGKTSPDGSNRFGTLNNCATGKTPWGTFVTCEENWVGYWRRGDDSANRTAGENALLSRYGIGNNSNGFAYREWDTVAGGSDLYKRFDITAMAAPATAADDFRNEPNLFGYIVEIDPFRPGQSPRVRTAMGRFSHETASFAPATAGKPVVVYSGDDARNEYIYKFVSTADWDAADANGGLAAGDKYLNNGTLYVARFNADGSGDWLPLTLASLTGAVVSGFALDTQAKILVGTRLAADFLGATKMDRPEWGAVNPRNGEVFFTLTNNRVSNRPVANLDAANPRAYEDLVGTDKGSDGNANGHIIRWKEDAEQAAISFTWDIFLFGSDADADATNINISGLTADNEFSSPDGIFVDPRGLVWIQTDDGALTDKTNNQMLVALPGSVDDRSQRTIVSTVGVDNASVTTFVGKSAAAVQLKRFLVGASESEITGIILTPDARTLFVNIQHPGENGDLATIAAHSSWPDASRDATALGDGSSRPRSATLVITRVDGGEIAL